MTVLDQVLDVAAARGVPLQLRSMCGTTRWVARVAGVTAFGASPASALRALAAALGLPRATWERRDG